MTNTVDNQPTAVSLQLTDELLGYQAAQSPPTRKVPVSQLGTYYLPKTGGVVTGSSTFSGGLVGTTTNDNAAAGQIGEYLSNAGSVPLISNQNTSVTSLSLTAGDWDVWGTLQLTSSDGASVFNCWVNTSTATPTGVTGYTSIALSSGTLTSGTASPVNAQRFSVAVTTNVFLVSAATFLTGTCSVSGVIAARRMR